MPTGVNKPRYESGWVRIEPGGTRDFRHEFGDIPVVVSVLASDYSNGDRPAVATSVTITSGVSVATVANSGATARYFKVRAI